MTARRSLVVFAAAAALLLALDALIYSQYRTEVRAVSGALDERLTALGTTTARWLATGGREVDPLLAALVRENRLEDAYVIDGALRVRAGVRTHAGAPLNLLRVDQDRLARALDGVASVGDGYSIENASVEVGYFPVADPTSHTVVVLEAGAEYREPATAPRTTFAIATALGAVVAAAFGLALWLALRALERTRVAHGRAERLAAVGQMAAMVAHEVRNPLGILRGQVELASERLPDAPPRERERFSEMLSEIGRLNELTEEFLLLARDVPIDHEEVALDELASAVAADARIAEPSATFTVEAAPIAIGGDETKLRQAIRNLVLNAAQVGGAGVAVRVEVAASTGGRVRVAVSDDGPGVAAELAQRLFEPFVTGRQGGSGLGLAIARRIAERHGGTLVLESTPGARGATFAMYLPQRGL